VTKGDASMKSMKERGVTYYIIGKEYDGKNKDLFKEHINLETLFINDITVMYDWSNGLCMIEDSVTFDGQGVSPLSAFLLTKVLTDDGVHEWMHRSTEEDRLDAN
jgi:hypothetical protein